MHLISVSIMVLYSCDILIAIVCASTRANDRDGRLAMPSFLVLIEERSTCDDD